MIDLAGNSSGSETRIILKDTLPPTTPTLVSPLSGIYLSGTTPSLAWTTATDTGVGLSGYIWQVSTGSTFASIYAS